MRTIEVVRPRTEPARAWVGPAVFLAIPLLLAVNSWWFPRVVGTGYLSWYLEQGAFLGILGSFVALVLEELEAETGLISANPREYFATCLQLAGANALVMAETLSPRAGPGSPPRFLWDSVVSALLGLLIVALSVAWTVVVAPLNYVATLVAGAPVRLAVHGSRRQIYARVVGSQVGITEVRDPDPSAAPPQGVRLSLAKRPLAATQALIALLLWLLGLAL